MNMYERIKQLLQSWTDKISAFWEEGCYIRSVLTLLLPITAVGLLIVVVIMTITAGFNFLRRYYAQLIALALALWAFIAWWDKHKTDKIEIERKEQEVRERQNYSERLEAARTKDATYTEQAKILFSVARELGPLGIVPPMRLSDLYSPGRAIPKANGMVNLNLYLFQTDREVVDTGLLKHTIQTKIDQRLQTGEFPGIPEQHIYRGRVYSGFAVDMVRDSMGGFVEVYTTFVDDAYCRYRENHELSSNLLLPSVDRRDTDY